jgi:hypothetical protein
VRASEVAALGRRAGSAWDKANQQPGRDDGGYSADSGPSRGGRCRPAPARTGRDRALILARRAFPGVAQKADQTESNRFPVDKMLQKPEVSAIGFLIPESGLRAGGPIEEWRRDGRDVSLTT